MNQFIHLNSLRTILRDTRSGIVTSTIHSVQSCGGELSLHYFMGLGNDKVAYARGNWAIGQADKRNHPCFKQCQIKMCA